jgi:glutamate dehydrogenase (NAD(P)+)
VPDFITNAGGVICGSVEYHGGREAAAFEQIAQKVKHNTEAALSRSRRENIEPRRAAVELARERVQAAMAFRRMS